jgi:3-methyladenine DNA glycosylase/8-oxoguanine DNA glycosylase
VAMRALGEPDAFPSGDLGLLRALDLESSAELERRAEAWRPWRAYAAMFLWNITNGSSGRESKRSGKSKSGLPNLPTSSNERCNVADSS